MNRILDLDPAKKLARVEPGVICDQLRNAAEHHGLTQAPDPATHAYCTLGGMIGNNSCGTHTLMGAPRMRRIWTYPARRRPPRRDLFKAPGSSGPLRGADSREVPPLSAAVSGDNLDELLAERGLRVARSLVGSESTCALVLSATVRLAPSPPHRVLLVIAYPNVFVAGDNAAAIRALGPIGLEGVQRRAIEDMQTKGKPIPGAWLLPDGDTWLVVEFGGPDEHEVEDREAMEKIRRGRGGPEACALASACKFRRFPPRAQSAPRSIASKIRMSGFGRRDCEWLGGVAIAPTAQTNSCQYCFVSALHQKCDRAIIALAVTADHAFHAAERVRRGRTGRAAPRKICVSSRVDRFVIRRNWQSRSAGRELEAHWSTDRHHGLLFLIRDS